MKVIYVDDNKDIRSLFTLKLHTICDAEIIELTSASEVISTLKENDDIAFIVSDFYMPGGNAEVIFNYLKTNSLDVPMILLSNVNLNSQNEFNDFFTYNNLNGHLPKPPKEKELFDLIHKTTTAILKKKPDKIKPSSPKDYYPVNGVIFDNLETVPVDIFIKISQNKYIRIIKAYSTLDELTVKEYRDKGITHFFIKSDKFDHFTRYCMDQLLDKFINNNQDEIFEVINLNKNTFYIVQDSLLAIGMGRMTISLAEQSLKSTLQLFLNIPNFSKMLKEMESVNSFLYKQALLRAYISFGIADNFDWMTKEIKDKLVLISLAQDITIKSEEGAKKYANSLGDKSELTIEEQNDFLSHPTKLKDLVKNSTVFPLDLCDVIAQHHELPDGSGFPKGLTSQQILPLASIIIVAERYANLIYKEKFEPNKNREIIQKMITIFNSGNFAKSLEGLQKTLNIN